MIIGPRYDYLCQRNELAKLEQAATSKYFDGHVALVPDVLKTCEKTLKEVWGIVFEVEEHEGVNEKVESKQLRFSRAAGDGTWVRVLLLRLPYGYKHLKDAVFGALKGKHVKRNLMWVVRAGEIEWEQDKRKQICFVPPLEKSTQTTLFALRQLLEDKQQAYDASPEHQAELATTIISQLRTTYVGQLLDAVRDRLSDLLASPESEGDPPDSEEQNGA